jgi:hypothetical protein
LVNKAQAILAVISEQNEDCQRLLTIPGVGLLTATALIAAIGDIKLWRYHFNGMPPFTQNTHPVMCATTGNSCFSLVDF